MSKNRFKLLKELLKTKDFTAYEAIDLINDKKVIIQFLLNDDTVDFNIIHQCRLIHPSLLSVQSAADSSHSIIYEHFDGDILTAYLDKYAFSVTDFIQIAIQLANGVEYLHNNQVLLKNINPDYILYNPDTNEVKIFNYLTDFYVGDESEQSVFRNKLEYIAPEQTKRLNKDVDQRSDLYSLGVVFYKIATGKLPFTSESDLELVYSQATQQAASPSSIRSIIPPIVSNIILKLLHKDKDNRYQSAKALVADLKRCKQKINDLHTLNFTLGQTDDLTKFNLTDTLYGRETEFQKLTDLFSLVKNGEKHLVTVAGRPGAGKSELIMHFFRKLPNEHFLFVEGKFEQFQEEIPYYAFRKAFGRFCSAILSENDEELYQWKERISSAVGIYGQLLIDIVPELEMIIGKQPPVPETNAYEAQKRFLSVFAKFMESICTDTCPMVLFLDDWQWTDQLSVDLLMTILQTDSIANLLVVTAFRSNEITDAHIFANSVLANQQIMSKAVQLFVDNITVAHISQLLSDSFLQHASDLDKLARIIYKKTAGNPFFSRTFIMNLHSEGHIFFNKNNNIWAWDYKKIEQKDVTGNLIDMLTDRIRFLSGGLKKLLEIASCIGNRFSVKSLLFVTEIEPLELTELLDYAVAEQLIVCQAIKMRSRKTGNCEHYKFVHDTIQQAFYNSIPLIKRKAIHYQIGKNLYENLDAAKLEERLFEVVNHLNAGTDKISSMNQLIFMLSINLRCCHKAKSELAYAHALKYVNTISKQIKTFGKEEVLWSGYYSQILSFYKLKSQIEYLNAEYSESEKTIHAGVARAETKIDKAELYYILIVQYTLEAKYTEAIGVASIALRLFGIDLPEKHFQEASAAEIEMIYHFFEKESVEKLAELPVMSSPEHMTIVKLLITMGPPCYRSHQQLWSVLVPKVVNLCIRYGNVPQIGYSYTALGGLLGWMKNDYDKTRRLGKVASQLMETAFNDPSEMSVFYLMHGSSIRHWVQHLKAATKDYEEAHRIGITSGNLQYTAYAYGHNMYCLFFQGVPLKQLKQKTEDYLAFAHERRNKWAIEVLTGGGLVIDQLQGVELDASAIEHYTAQCEQHKNIQVLCVFNVLQTFAYIINGNFQAAEQAHKKAENRIFSVGIQGLLPWPEHVYNACLLLIYKIDKTANQSIKKKLLTYLHAKLRLFELWQSTVPENYTCKLELLRAEVNRLYKFRTKAWDNYEKAIESARKNEFYQHLAFINERCARFWLNSNRQKIAIPYLEEAVQYYKKWGATLKLKLLETEFVSEAPHVFISQNNHDSKTYQKLDLETIYTFTHSIAQQVTIKKLSKELALTAMKSTKADRSVVLFNTKDRLTAEAEATNEKTEARLLHSVAINSYSKVPHNAINYVLHTKSKVLHNIESLEAQFGQDAYFKNENIKSIACIPLLHSNRLLGVLYLESKLFTDHFTENKIELLELLSTHMAISIENAIIYNDLEEIVAKRTNQLEESQSKLKVSNATKDKFLSIISHDLRSPFSSMLGFSKLLLKEYHKFDDSKRLYIIENIYKALQSTFQLLEDILTWSRSQTGKIEIKPSNLYLEPFFAEISAMMKTVADKKGITIQTDIQEEISVYADKNSIYTVMRNLISNAIKFSFADTVIHLKAEKMHDNSDEFVKISVVDNGVGMSDQKQKELFKIDTNISTLGTDQEKGTGLGLILCKEFVERNKGEIGVESTEGKGSVFYFSLPSGKQISDQKEHAFKTVVIADDLNVNFLYLNEMVLKHFPNTIVKKAVNGKEAIQLCAKEKVDCMLMDINMPEMDGIEATMLIKQMKPDIKIIIQTANLNQQVLDQAKKAGGDYYITKPIAPNVLLPILEKCLK